MVNHSDENITWIHGFNDIYIPVPYDPEIPGVRCVGAEEVESEDDIGMVTEDETKLAGHEAEGEATELQDLRYQPSLYNENISVVDSATI